MDYIFEENFKVRDYECDLQGIVNNANYQHYMEHTRHEFLSSLGISFSDLHARGIDAVVAKVEIAYKRPLRSGDEFVCKLNIKKEGLKYVFFQDIYKLPELTLCNKGKFDTVCVVNGKLGFCDELDKVFAPFLDKK